MMHFYLYTGACLLFPLGSTLILILQLLADKSNRKSGQDTTDKRTKMLLYAVYVSAICCGIIGLSLHVTMNPIWCENIGFPPCFAMYGAAKASAVYFFVRRAKLAQGMIKKKWKRLLFDYIAPSYIIIYFLVYCVLSSIVFAGKYVPNGISS